MRMKKKNVIKSEIIIIMRYLTWNLELLEHGTFAFFGVPCCYLYSQPTNHLSSCRSVNNCNRENQVCRHTKPGKSGIFFSVLHSHFSFALGPRHTRVFPTAHTLFALQIRIIIFSISVCCVVWLIRSSSRGRKKETKIRWFNLIRRHLMFSRFSANSIHFSGRRANE